MILLFAHLRIRVNEEMFKNIRKEIENNKYKSISEFVRIAIDEKLKSYKFDFIFETKKTLKDYNTNIKFIKDKDNILLGEKYE